MSTQSDKDIAERYFVHPLEEYILPDVESLLSIKREGRNGQCGTPMAMLIVSALDFIGYVIMPGSSEEKKVKANESTANIIYALEYNKLLPSIYQESETIRRITIVYRGKLMHHSFNMASYKNNEYGITRSESESLFDETPERILLNVNIFAKDFSQYVRTLINEVRGTNNAQLLNNVKNSFKLRELIMNHTESSTTIPPGNIKNK